MNRFLAIASIAVFAIALSFSASPRAVAAGISVSQTLDRNSIAYEDKAHLEIVLTWSGSQFAYRFDKPLQPTLDKLKVQQFSSTISSSGSGADEVTTKKYAFTLAPTGSGMARIEPITISYVTWPDSVLGSLVTEGMTLNIAAAIPVPKGGKWPLPVTLPVLIVIGVVVLGGGTGAVLVIRKRNKRPAEVVKTPAELFLERLAQTRDEAGGDLKRFQTGLYKNLLWYLGLRYSLDFSGQAVEDIVKTIDAVGMPETEKDRICGWLLRADREKFSPATPAPGETIRLETEVREFFETMQSQS